MSSGDFLSGAASEGERPASDFSEKQRNLINSYFAKYLGQNSEVLEEDSPSLKKSERATLI